VRRLWLLGLALGAASALAFAAPAARAAGECDGIPQCVAVPGPWVAVPATGSVEFLLSCPGGKGVVGGTDALVTEAGISVTFDALPGSPISPGRTTNSEALFRAVSDHHRAGMFEPFVGCIPTAGSVRNTTGVLPLGPPLDLRAGAIPAVPGAARSAAIGCPQGEQLVDSWTATAFATSRPPALRVAGAIRVRAGVRDGVAVASVVATGALPPAAHGFVQLGVRCGQG
jgi:hypothetical protein